MIEIEQKFLLNTKELDRLIEGADFLGEKTFVDEYYDRGDHELISNDLWFRRRDVSYELKIPVGTGGTVNQYRELTQVSEIISFFGEEKGFEDFLSEFYTLCRLTTVRKKYKKQGFSIDIDSVSFDNGDFYWIVEIEKLIKDEAKIEEERKNLISFAESHGLALNRVRGKLLEYFYRYKPEVLKKIPGN